MSGAIFLLESPNGRLVHAVSLGEDDVAFRAVRDGLALAKRYLLNATALLNRVVDVVRVGSKEQVQRINAAGRVAPMADLSAGGYRAVGNLVGKTMRQNAGIGAVRTKHPVALFPVASGCPKPAIFGFLHLGEKAQERVFSGSLSHGGIMSNRPAQVNGRVSHF